VFYFIPPEIQTSVIFVFSFLLKQVYKNRYCSHIYERTQIIRRFLWGGSRET